MRFSSPTHSSTSPCRSNWSSGSVPEEDQILVEVVAVRHSEVVRRTGPQHHAGLEVEGAGELSVQFVGDVEGVAPGDVAVPVPALGMVRMPRGLGDEVLAVVDRVPRMLLPSVGPALRGDSAVVSAVARKEPRPPRVRGGRGSRLVDHCAAYSQPRRRLRVASTLCCYLAVPGQRTSASGRLRIRSDGQPCVRRPSTGTRGTGCRRCLGRCT